MKLKLLTFSLIIFGGSLLAQVEQNIIVEHFTNTVCSICASQNPGLFNNLSKNPNVLHIAVHPTSPYSQCVLAQFNPVENDARTKYYGIYGGTPRIVINGSVVSPMGGFTNNTLFDTFKNKTTPFKIEIVQTLKGNDSIITFVTVKALGTHNETNLSLYVPLVQDSLVYTSPNGEKVHHHVLRKIMISQTIVAPANGDSVVLRGAQTLDVGWKYDEMSSIAMLQNPTTKKMLQVASTNLSNNSAIVSGNASNKFTIFPNPVNKVLQFNAEKTGTVYLFDALGTLVMETALIKSNQLDMTQLTSGIYFIKLTEINGQVYQAKFVKN